jgi:hypothetical protein
LAGIVVAVAGIEVGTRFVAGSAMGFVVFVEIAGSMVVCTAQNRGGCRNRSMVFSCVVEPVRVEQQQRSMGFAIVVEPGGQRRESEDEHCNLGKLVEPLVGGSCWRKVEPLVDDEVEQQKPWSRIACDQLVVVGIPQGKPVSLTCMQQSHPPPYLLSRACRCVCAFSRHDGFSHGILAQQRFSTKQ